MLKYCVVFRNMYVHTLVHACSRTRTHKHTHRVCAVPYGENKCSQKNLLRDVGMSHISVVCIYIYIYTYVCVPTPHPRPFGEFNPRHSNPKLCPGNVLYLTGPAVFWKSIINTVKEEGFNAFSWNARQVQVSTGQGQ